MSSQITKSSRDYWLECVPRSSCLNCLELKNIGKQLDVAEHGIENIRARRSVLVEAITARGDPLTTKLPFELVAKVFEQYIYMHTTDLNDYRYPLYPGVEIPQLFRSIYPSAPLRLGAVCRLWRKIAWTHPQLWTTLDILLSAAKGAEIVSEWLSRASTHPVFIRVHHPAGLLNNDDIETVAAIRQNTLQIIASINRHASQWGCLDFSDVPLDIVSKLDDSHCTDADQPSMLQRISIGDAMSSALRDSNRKLFKTNRIHRPTHLHILTTLRPDRLPIDWTRITHIHLESMDRRAFYSVLILAQYKNAPLTHLSAVCVFGGEEWSPNKAIQLSSLTSLTIEDEMSSMSPQDLFARLQAPSLRIMKYCGWGDIPIPVDELIELVGRSKCALKTLHLVRPTLSDEDLIRLLRAMPFVRNLELNLHDENKIESLLDALSQANLRTGKTPFLPRLTRLNIWALPPNKWTSLVGVLTDRLSVLDDELSPPLRKDLRINFTIRMPARTSSIDRVSLLKLGELYRKHGIFCVLKAAEEENGASFLLESLRIHFPDIEMSGLDNAEYQNMIAMSQAGAGT